MLYINVGEKVLTAVFEDNSSAKALAEKLESGDVTISMHDYGNFEKVGSLGFDLPRNDRKITTSPGDIILYLGNQLTIYYDENTWSFTKVARIDGVSGEDLKEILGSGDVVVTLSLQK